MDVGDSTQTIDLTPGATTGVLFDGMTADGSKVFFTTPDKLDLGGDTDTSADIYQAAVAPAGRDAEPGLDRHRRYRQLRRLRPGRQLGGSQAHWNTVGATTDCGVVAIGGGGGVAASPGPSTSSRRRSSTAAEGTADQPNLYVVGPAALRISSSPFGRRPLVRHATQDAETRMSSDFQTSGDGGFAVFPSTLSLTGYANVGFTEIYRYDTSAEELACVSCNPTNAGAEGRREAGLRRAQPHRRRPGLLHHRRPAGVEGHRRSRRCL